MTWLQRQLFNDAGRDTRGDFKLHRMATTRTPVTPDRVMQLMFGHAPTQDMCAAIDLNLFGLISEGVNTVSGLAEKAEASERGVQLLVNALCAMGLMSKQDGILTLAPDAEIFLVPSSKAYLGGMSTQVQMSWSGWAALADAVKKGGAADDALEEDRGGFFAPWVQSLFNLNFPAAQAVAGLLGTPETALDIGAGSGVWSLALALASQQTRVTVVELQQVVNEVTEPMAQRMGIGDRYQYLVGDFHQVKFPEESYDVAYLGHILYSEGEEQSKRLMERAFRALRSGGTLVVAEMIPDENKSQDLLGNLFGLNMLVHTHHGTVFSQTELEEMARNGCRIRLVYR